MPEPPACRQAGSLVTFGKTIYKRYSVIFVRFKFQDEKNLLSFFIVQPHGFWSKE